MKAVNIHEAKTHFSRLLVRVMGGEEIIIAKAGKPVARLIPYKKPPTKREPGTAQGQITVSSDFHQPLPEEVLKGFEG
ncbi:MAG: type II toxin-antitoxin system Phd/YefM family antitoxin [Chloroflexota bacterium]